MNSLNKILRKKLYYETRQRDGYIFVEKNKEKNEDSADFPV